MDLTDSIASDAKVEIVTLDLEGLDIMRHTIAAQVLASCKEFISKFKACDRSYN